MEMEHINENLIKVLIDTEDLAERGINFLDLIGDQSSIEKFFYSILEEVDVDQHFQESEAVTFQVMPNKDGLELYISRNNFEEMEAIFEDELTQRLLERKKKTRTDRQKAKAAKYEQLGNQAKSDRDSKKDALCKIVQFESLEDFLKSAREIADYSGKVSLYFMNEQYYLVLDPLDQLDFEESEMTHPLWSLLEYGIPSKVSLPLLIEHGELIRDHDAISFFGQNY